MKKLLTVFLLGLCTLSYGQNDSFIFVFLNKKPDGEKLSQEQEDKLMEGHLANINKMASEGKLLAAGPFDGGGGIFIFKSTSTKEVKGWIQDDPAVKANRWNIEVLPFRVRAGSVCAVSEPYEMVTYNFIRYVPAFSKFTVSDAPVTFKSHDDYLKKIEHSGNVIAEGIFGENDGGILIMKGDLQKEVIEFDPGVQQGLLELEFKNLWIAKGSFCEK